MIFKIFWPLLEMTIFLGIRFIKMLKDQNWDVKNFNLLPNKTKCQTITEYEELYSGMEFNLHYRYANLSNITFICFIFGPGMPVMFPLGLCAFIVMFVLDKIMLAKFSRRPPDISLRMMYECL
jgi:hypothetical protein